MKAGLKAPEQYSEGRTRQSGYSFSVCSSSHFIVYFEVTLSRYLPFIWLSILQSDCHTVVVPIGPAWCRAFWNPSCFFKVQNKRWSLFWWRLQCGSLGSDIHTERKIHWKSGSILKVFSACLGHFAWCNLNKLKLFYESQFSQSLQTTLWHL